MRGKQLKGMKVLDNDGIAVGKVSDLGINCDEFKIESILVSTGGFFGKKYFTVDLGQIGEINDYLHLKSSKISQTPAVSFKELEMQSPEVYFFKNFQYRIVQNVDSNFFGLVDDIKFDLRDNLIFDVIVEQSHDKKFGKTYLTTSLKDFDEVDVLMILNLGKDQIKERIN